MSKVQFGLSDVYYAIRNDNGSYKTPVHMLGAEQLSISSNNGNGSTIWADNINFWDSSATGSISGDLQMAKFPKSFYTDVLGQSVETGGAISAGPTDTAAHFALLFQLTTDLGGKRYCWYDCTATAPTFTASTNTDSISEDSETSTITANSATTAIGIKTSIHCETGDTDYATWFNAVPYALTPSA